MSDSTATAAIAMLPSAVTGEGVPAAPGLHVSIGAGVILWQRKSRVALRGVISGFDEDKKKFQVDYHNGTTVHVSREWLEERMKQARENAGGVEAAGEGQGAMGDGGGDGDGGAAAGVEAMREATFRRLQERHAQRKKDMQARKAADAAKADPKESPARFWEAFSARLAATDALIKACVATHTKKLKRAAAKKEISAISASIEEASELLADASRFLPKYDCRTAQGQVHALLSQFDDARAAIFPRQKFSFGSRVALKEKGTVASSVVAQMKAQQHRDKSVSGGGGTREGHTAETNANVRWTSNANELIFADRDGASILLGPGALQAGGTKPAEISWGADTGGGSAGGQMMDVVLSNMIGCTVVICDVIGGMRLDNLKDCHVYTGPVAGSVFADRCEGCTFFIAAKQMRIHNTRGCAFCVHTQSGPIIEDCVNLAFSCYGLRYPGVDEHFLRASLLRPNQWADVKDFKWLRNQVHSPNWHALPEEKRLAMPRLTPEIRRVLDAAAGAAVTISPDPVEYVPRQEAEAEAEKGRAGAPTAAAAAAAAPVAAKAGTNEAVPGTGEAAAVEDDGGDESSSDGEL